MEKAIAELCKKEPAFRQASSLVGRLKPLSQDRGFETLLKTIVSQQVSLASAAALWLKLHALGECSPEGFLSYSDSDLRMCGLSASKIRYGRDLARHICQGDLDLRALDKLPDEEAIDTLTKIKGIGSWTAEIYLLFALRRPDICPAGDLALRESARLLFSLAERPNETEFKKMAVRWRPWRSMAARMLWAYYRQQKGRAGVW